MNKSNKVVVRRASNANNNVINEQLVGEYGLTHGSSAIIRSLRRGSWSFDSSTDDSDNVVVVVRPSPTHNNQRRLSLDNTIINGSGGGRRHYGSTTTSESRRPLVVTSSLQRIISATNNEDDDDEEDANMPPSLSPLKDTKLIQNEIAGMTKLGIPSPTSWIWYRILLPYPRRLWSDASYTNKLFAHGN